MLKEEPTVFGDRWEVGGGKKETKMVSQDFGLNNQVNGGAVY